MSSHLRFLVGAAALAGISFLPAASAQDMSRNIPSATDTAWAQRAAQSGAAEVRLGDLARLRSVTPAVKELAQRLADDHKKAGDELKQIAGRKQLPLPGTADAKFEALYQRLSQLKGVELDQAYVTAAVDRHRLDIADFQKQADAGGDPELKSFAIKILPVLQEHLRLAEIVRTQVEK